jgi:nucleotide-binding universal stress UspA family protein
MIRNILIPVDDFQRAQKAVYHAASLATPDTLVHLVGMMELPKTQFADPVTWNIAGANMQSLLNELGAYLEIKGIATTSDILKNPVADAFIHYVGQSQGDLVILGVDYDGNAPLMQSLLRLSSVPILIVRDRPEQMKYRKILIPLDQSQRAECVLPLVSAFTQSIQATLVFAHIIQKPEMPRRNFISSEDSELSQRLIEANQIEAEQYLSQLAQRHEVVTETHLLVNDNVPTALHQLIQRENIDLVILSAHGYSGEPRATLGSIAHNLINLCTIAIVVIQDMPASIDSTNMEALRK